MTRATSVVRKTERGDQPAGDTITLARADRFKRRIALRTDHGREFLLDLPEATYLAHGDALALTDGTLVEVRSAAEPLLEIHVHDATALARIAWHIGNRHTPAEVTANAIYIQPDHVLADMVIGLGGHVHHVVRPFEPEGGAYGGKGPLNKGHSHHGHGHHHHDDHHHGSGGHDHGGAHDHEHGRSVHRHGAMEKVKPSVWRPS